MYCDFKILTQDRTMIIDFDEMYVDDYMGNSKYIVTENVSFDNPVILGKYESIERCKEVMLDLSEKMNACISNVFIYVMPEK